MLAQLHVSVGGPGGAPVVVFEAGIAASSISWCLAAPMIAEIATVVSYDRAGLGRSYAQPRPAGTALESAEGLARMLEGSGFPAPYVLVGHSFGGLIVRLYQQHYPKRVAGMVLVDPLVRSEWREPGARVRNRLARGAKLSRRGAWLARIGVVGGALKLLMSGSRRIPKLLGRAASGDGSSVMNRLIGEVRKMPVEVWPEIARQWSRPEPFLTIAANLEKLPESAAQLDESLPLGDLPLVVLSGSKSVPEHERDARLSTRGEYVIVPNSGHWIQLDAPLAVTEAVARVIALKSQVIETPPQPVHPL